MKRFAIIAGMLAAVMLSIGAVLALNSTSDHRGFSQQVFREHAKMTKRSWSRPFYDNVRGAEKSTQSLSPGRGLEIQHDTLMSSMK